MVSMRAGREFLARECSEGYRVHSTVAASSSECASSVCRVLLFDGPDMVVKSL